MKQEWRRLAACHHTDPDAPFAPEGSDEAALFAKFVCGECPVRTECLEWALGRQDSGIYGGLTPTQRAAEAKKRSLVDRIDHGTNRGYYQHRRAGQDACPGCRQAHNEHSARWHAENSDRVSA